MHSNLLNRLIKLFVGFSFVGLFTTLLSLALMFFFLKVLHTPLIITYIGIYFATILMSFLLNSRLVFKSNLSFANGIKYFIVYISGMLMGTLLLWLFKKILPFENYILGFLVLPFTMIWNFVFSYVILKPKKHVKPYSSFLL
jgi:putative flippase GtrA